MRILAIETSCDETAASIVEADNYLPKIITHAVASQIEIHSASGGVIPNLAARLHVENLPYILKKATDNGRERFDAVAVTTGPGLIGALLMGVTAAKAIASTKNIPFYAVNHLEGHIYSAWLAPKNAKNFAPPQLPALIVIVSGGHTELALMHRHGYYDLLGSTRDDAAGEAFDKVARLLELPYPGGPEISNLAEHGDRHAYKLPISFNDDFSLEFSFSGIKAHVANIINKLPKPIPAHIKADIAASFEHTVAETISLKTVNALEQFPGIKSVCLVGGVAANKYLRSYLEQKINQSRPQVAFITAPLEYCTDNAAMIGAAAVFRHYFGRADDWKTAQADPNLNI